MIDEGGGGISAGMSGSPVYTEDGKLIGAIAYVFSVGPSSIGGVTPAPDMLRVFAEGAAPAEQGSAAARLAPAAGLGSRARRASRCPRWRRRWSPEGAGHGVRKPPPRAAPRASRCPDRGRCPRDRQPRCERHRPPGTTVGEARAWRRDRSRAVLGDFTVPAIGTTTYVCGGQAVAFGHSFLFTGPTVIGATRARVLGIVADPTLGRSSARS